MNFQEIKSNLASLPLKEQEEILSLLEKNISTEYEKLADSALAHDLEIVEKRIQLYDSGTMEAYAWDSVMQELFPKS